MSHIYLQKAIHNHEVATFTYQNVSTVVEPYTLGLNADGQITLAGWQISGENGVGWRYYLIDKMRGASPTGLFFQSPRLGYNPNDPTMKHVLIQIKRLVEAA